MLRRVVKNLLFSIKAFFKLNSRKLRDNITLAGKIDKFPGGWIVGNFPEAVFRTKKFEVAYRKHKKLEPWESHYHKKSKEINILVKGRMSINNQDFKTGDIFIIEPYTISRPVYYTDCYLVIIRTKSKPKDKHIIEN